MLKRFSIYVIVVLALVLLSTSLNNGGPELVAKAYKVDEGNLFRLLFKEPVEICYIMLKNGTIFKITQYFENKVYINIEQMRKELKEYDCDIKDIVIIIHNHLDLSRISEQDKKIYRYLRQEGFKGVFAIFLQGADTVLIYEEKE